MTTLQPSPHDNLPDWRLVEPPPELWPLVVASTIGRSRMRRQVLRSLRVPLAIAAAALIAVSSATTVWVVHRLSPRAQSGAPIGGAPGTSRGPHAPGAPRAPRAPQPRR